MKTQIFEGDLPGKVATHIEHINYGRGVMFFDDDSYFIVKSEENPPLTLRQLAGIGICSDEEIEARKIDTEKAIVNIRSEVRNFKHRYPEAYLIALTDEIEK